MLVRVFFNFEDVLFKFAYIFCDCGISDSGALAVFIAGVFYGTRDSVSCVFSLPGVANGLLFLGFIYFFCDRGDFRLWGSGRVHSRCLLRDSGLGLLRVFAAWDRQGGAHLSSVFYGNSVLANPHQLFRRWRFGVAASQTCAVSNAGTCMSDFLVANVNFLSALFPILSVVGLQGTDVLKSLIVL